MIHHLANKHILLGITGSIAAYKSADLVRRLRYVGAGVRVAMTVNAKRFITPLTMQALSGHPVHDDLFDVQAEAAMGHIELARWADIVLVAPASADFMAKLAHGFADDLLTTLCLATDAPIVLAPAMNQAMWMHVLTQENRSMLEHKGIHLIGPALGSQACGDIGPGRMLEPLEIIEKISGVFSTDTLSGLKVLVTAGPTHEAIDPVRFISNGSSGKMGYALAEAAEEAGAAVRLVSGPVSLPNLPRIDCIHVVSAKEMHDAVLSEIADYDIFIAVAAVSDYRAKTVAPQKIHKVGETMHLVLERTQDIVSTVGQLSDRPFIVGFSAETDAVRERAYEKYQRKNMDMIIANRVGFGVGMGSDENEVTVLGKNIEVTLPSTHKHKLARQLITMVATQFKARNTS